MILGVLVGNTCVQHGRFDLAVEAAGAIPAYGRIAWREAAAELRALADAGVRQLVLGSVRDDLAERLCAELGDDGPSVVMARRDFSIPIENRYARPEEVGTDRLLGAVAAKFLAGDDLVRRGGAIVVDFGTAVSVSVVGPRGAFEGGAIAAGVPTLRAGLASRTPALPEPRFRRPASTLARTTADALASGLYWQVAGGVNALLDELASELGASQPMVFATGGDAELFAPAVQRIERVVPWLTLAGLRRAWEGSTIGNDTPGLVMP